ncbi:MAG: SUMF1/EgtB/PvdO family nonheme iron enzyme [Planctomycetaceae bacterium]|nr:SUMF1/EgtB/PvdO family nonheme iron enzyme [Planctomycetaceae bacterium]
MPSASALDRKRAEEALDALVEQQRIDDAIRKRALDVLFSPVKRSDNDDRLYEIFRKLLLAEGEAREDLLRRLSNDIVRALDPVLRETRWTVAASDDAPRRHAELAARAPAIDAGLDELVGEYPLQVRDVRTGIVFRLVPGGTVPRPDGREEVVEPFYIAKSEVDWCDWFRFMGGMEASGQPVEGRAWLEVADFVAKAHLSLPTEAEWEFAARSGMPTAFWMGALAPPGTVRCKVDTAADAANQQNEYFPRNYLSLAHVHGNVGEWCTHPLGTLGGVRQPARGGGYIDPVERCTASSVKMLPVGSRGEAKAVGFRPIRRIQPGFTKIDRSGEAPLRVVVVEKEGALDDHWQVKILCEAPDPLVHRLDPEYCKRVLSTGFPWEVEDGVTNVRMRLVPPGEFTMRASHPDAPSFRVLIQHPFYLGVTEITHAEWGALLPNDAGLLLARMPIDGKSWEECRKYLRAARTGLRFPNEFEWQLACNLGRNQPFAWSDLERVRSDRAYCNAGGGPLLPSGAMFESPFGFRGMHGNVREWCLNPADLDGLIPDMEDHLRLEGTQLKSIRGGRVADSIEQCQADVRRASDMFAGRAGLRIARSVPKDRSSMVTEWPANPRRRPDDVERPRPSDPNVPLDPRGNPPGEKSPTEKDGGRAAPAKQAEEDEEEREQTDDPRGGRRGNGVGTVGGKRNGGAPNTPSGDPDDGQSPPDMPEGPVETSSGGG